MQERASLQLSRSTPIPREDRGHRVVYIRSNVIVCGLRDVKIISHVADREIVGVTAMARARKFYAVRDARTYPLDHASRSFAQLRQNLRLH